MIFHFHIYDYQFNRNMKLCIFNIHFRLIILIIKYIRNKQLLFLNYTCKDVDRKANSQVDTEA